jgi:hypothetical protein
MISVVCYCWTGYSAFFVSLHPLSFEFSCMIVFVFTRRLKRNWLSYTPTWLLYTIIQKCLEESRSIDLSYMLCTHKRRAKCVFVESKKYWVYLWVIENNLRHIRRYSLRCYYFLSSWTSLFRIAFNINGRLLPDYARIFSLLRGE